MGMFDATPCFFQFPHRFTWVLAHEAKCVNTSEASPQTDEDRVGRIALAPSDSLASRDEMSDSAGARSDLPGVIHKI